MTTYYDPTTSIPSNLITQPNFPQQIFQQIYQPVVLPKQATPSLSEAFKPKRAGKNKSHIIFILDDSLSMQKCRDNTISGFNEYLKGQQEDARATGIETFVSLYKFDGSSVKCTIDHANVQEVALLTRDNYNPLGATNLLDAIGGVMMQINTKLSASEKKNRESVIITILTDGEENSSSTFGNDDIKAMVEKAEGKNWGFMFLGANINAFSAGSKLGFGVNNTIQYDTQGTANAIRTASAATSRMKSAYASGMETSLTYASMGFTEEERTMAVTKDV